MKSVARLISRMTRSGSNFGRRIILPPFRSMRFSATKSPCV